MSKLLNRSEPEIDPPAKDWDGCLIPLAWGFAVGLFLLCLFGGCHHDQAFASEQADTKEHYTQEQEIKAIIGEAEGEPQKGKNAVACAISNRHSLSGVYGLYAYRVQKRLYSQQTYNNALKAIVEAKNPEYCQELIKGASFWEGTAFKLPYWAKGMKVTAVIGHQRFFGKG